MQNNTWIFVYTIFVSLLIEIETWSLNNFLMTGPKVYNKRHFKSNGLADLSNHRFISSASSTTAYMVFSESVAAGAQTGVKECKDQFKWDRWNCPENTFSLFTHNALPRANKETSFVHAITSAGVMFTLTRNCSLGDFDKCSCDDSKKGQPGGARWNWGGCSDNVRFGEKISKQFVDTLETGKDARATMNLHNNDVGRRAVRKTLKMSCKCHGISGACTIKTCWQQLSEFRAVGSYLKKKYQRAKMVDFQDGKLNIARNSERRMRISKTDLLYLESSPDYCRVNVTAGTYGTLGRECVRPLKKGDKLDRWERRSCKFLCKTCGLRVKKKVIEDHVSCNCKFHWCCAVKCESCKETITKFACAKVN
ncbi:protein Wnt-8b-like isoform X2 [Lineus longissimus]|uniref:protein Wnt-8b-like isoform X2 n=1 Tax=Lineus longissimus TaxID=88925 RepID=UPI00315DE117